MATLADQTTPDLTAQIKAAGTTHVPNDSEVTHTAIDLTTATPKPALPTVDAAWGIPTEELRAAVQTFQRAEKDAQRADWSVRQAEQIAGVQQAAVSQPAVASTEAPSTAAEPVSINKQPNGEYEVKLETGETFRGTADQVIATIGKAKLDTSYWGRGLNAQLKALREQTPQFPQQTPQYPQSQYPQPNGSEDGLGEFLLDTTARKLGVRDGSELLSSISGLLETRQREESQNVAARFLSSCPDFPVGNEKAYAVLDRVMAQNGWPLTADSMSAAHAYAVRYQLYQPLTQEQVQQTLEMNAAKAIPRPVAPPMVSTSQPELSSGRLKNPWEMTEQEARQAYFTEYANQRGR